MADDNPSAKKRPRLQGSETVDSIENQLDKEGCSAQLQIQDSNNNQQLVLDLVIQNTSCVKLLKECRLVNKISNIQACNRLRKVSITKLQEDRMKEFTQTLVARCFGTLSSLPSPFKNCNVTGDYFTDSTFCNLVLSPAIRATCCTINLGDMTEDDDDDDEDEDDRYKNNPEMTEFLRLNQRHLTDLTITNVSLHAMVTILAGIKFTSLKKLVVKKSCCETHGNDNDRICRHVEALKNALPDSALAVVDIKISSFPCFFSLLAMNLTHITKLNLEMNNLGYECWDALANLQLPSLQDLTLLCKNSEDGRFSQQLNSFLGNVAVSLKRLKYDLIGELQMNFIFEELGLINIPAPKQTKLQQLITLARFPKLQNVWLEYSTVQNMKFLDKDFNSHHGITQFGIKIKPEVVESQLDAIFPLYLINLKRLFPNIEDLGIKTNRASWTPSFLLYTYSVFPHLKSMRILSPFDFLTLSGVTPEQVHESAGMSAQNIPRRNSLCDFKDIEKLRLCSASSVSNDMIQHCLSLLPKLKHLQTSWNPNLSIGVFEKSFQHLQELRINNFSDLSKNQLLQFKHALPACKVRK